MRQRTLLRILSPILLWCQSVLGHATDLSIGNDAVKIVEADATYTMGDSDTLASAEEIALLRAKRNAVEIAGVYIETSSTDMERTKDGETSQLQALGVRTIGAAVTETQILDRRRNLEGGRPVFYVKIRTTVHVGWLLEAVKRLKANEQLAAHHKQLHAEYSQLKAELDRLRNQLREQSTNDVQRAVPARNPGQAAAHTRAAVETRSLPEKINLATQAIAADDEYVDAYIVRGQTYLRIASITYGKKEKRADLNGYVDHAIEDFDHALSLAPTSTWALVGRGDALTWQRKSAEAARNYEEALRADPLFDLARQRLISLYTGQARKQVENNHWEEALTTLQKVFTGDNGRGWVSHQKEALLLRSQVYRRLGQLERAMDDLTTIVNVDPTHGEAFFERARIYEQLMQGRLAKDDFEKACLLGLEAACEATHP